MCRQQYLLVQLWPDNKSCQASSSKSSKCRHSWDRCFLLHANLDEGSCIDGSLWWRTRTYLLCDFVSQARTWPQVFIILWQSFVWNALGHFRMRQTAEAWMRSPLALGATALSLLVAFGVPSTLPAPYGIRHYASLISYSIALSLSGSISLSLSLSFFYFIRIFLYACLLIICSLGYCLSLFLSRSFSLSPSLSLSLSFSLSLCLSSVIACFSCMCTCTNSCGALSFQRYPGSHFILMLCSGVCASLKEQAWLWEICYSLMSGWQDTYDLLLALCVHHCVNEFTKFVEFWTHVTMLQLVQSYAVSPNLLMKAVPMTCDNGKQFVPLRIHVCDYIAQVTPEGSEQAQRATTSAVQNAHDAGSIQWLAV